MIFDIAIMNPPYDGNLHLQIIEHIQHNAVKIVNISPIRWLEDPLARYKPKSDYNTFKDTISDNEVKNCFKYLTSRVMKCYAILARENQRVPWQFVPALDFTKCWSEKDLCDYFELNGYIDDNNAEPDSDWKLS